MNDTDYIYYREYWVGDSRDGSLINGDGYHYYRMEQGGKIVEAYEYYEQDDGIAIVSPLPEMNQVHWINDLGFEDMEILDSITPAEFDRIKEIGKD